MSNMEKGMLIYSLILLLILGIGVLFLPIGAQTITANVNYDPKFINLALPAPSVVKATIRFPSGSKETVNDINASTILLEGTLSPDTTYFIKGGLVAEFDGYMVVNIILSKIAHLGIGPPYKVYLSVTGNLKDDAGGTPFSGTDWIKVRGPHIPPPP